MASYKRVLCKLSGESLSSSSGFGYDPSSISSIAKTLSAAVDRGVELAVVIGAGNLFRGQKADLPYKRTSLDQVGMLATLMNGKILKEALFSCGKNASIFNAFTCGSFANIYTEDAVEKAFSQGHIAIFTGGTSHPFLTTDTAAALRAAEIRADALIKLSTVSCIYDKDPHLYPDAKQQQKLTYREVIEKKLAVMDLEAIVLCEKENIPIIVTNFSDEMQFLKAVSNETVGTLVTSE